jgi:hypothetical protein
MFNTAMRDAMNAAAMKAAVATPAGRQFAIQQRALVNTIFSHADRQKLLASRINLHRSGPR